MKNSTLRNIPVVLTLWLAGCGGTTPPEAIWKGEMIQLSAERIASDRTFLRFSPIILFGDYLVISSYDKEGYFSLFELNDDSVKYAGNFLSIGRGPHEVMAARGHYMSEENLFCIVGFNQHGKNMFVPLDNPDNLFDPKTWTVSENSVTGGGLRVIPIDSHSMMEMRAKVKDDRMFSVIDLDNNSATELDIVIPDDVKAPVLDKFSTIYLGEILKRPYHNQFVYSSQEGNLVKVFEVTDKKIDDSFDIFDELPLYHHNGGRIRRGKDNKSGLRLYTTKKHIYMGDCKLTEGMVDRALQINGYQRGYMKEMYVSDWEGNHLAKYVLDVPVVYYTVDEDDNYMYAFSYNEETLEDILVRFKLPSLDK